MPAFSSLSFSAPTVREEHKVVLPSKQPVFKIRKVDFCNYNNYLLCLQTSVVLGQMDDSKGLKFELLYQFD